MLLSQQSPLRWFPVGRRLVAGRMPQGLALVHMPCVAVCLTLLRSLGMMLMMGRLPPCRIAREVLDGVAWATVVVQLVSAAGMLPTISVSEARRHR